MTAQHKTYIHCHDLNTKFPTLHPYNRVRLNSIKFIVSSNSLPANPKLIYLLTNLSQSITGQVPAVIKAKKSVASFKLRKDSPVAIYTTLRKQKAQTLLNLLTVFYIPQLISLNPKYRLPNVSGFLPIQWIPQRAQAPKSQLYSFGFSNISFFTHLHPLAIQPSFEVGFPQMGGQTRQKGDSKLSASNKKGATPKGHTQRSSGSEGVKGVSSTNFGFKQIGGYIQFNISCSSFGFCEARQSWPTTSKISPYYFYISQLIAYPF